MRSRRLVSALAVVAAGSMVLAACGSSSSSKAPSSAGSSTAGNTASDVGITPTTIKIGYISSLTGNASSTFADGPAGALARINAQNAAGGVNGRKIELVPIDDQSSPAGDETASKELASQKGVFGVIDFSPYTFGGARVLAQAGIPVTGYAFDGPEWGQAGYSNMFSFLPPDSTVFNGEYHYYNFSGQFMASIGAKKIAGLAYGISPSSQASIKVIFAGASQSGVSSCYENYSVPFGGVDFTADVLQIKNAGCDGVVGSFVDASDVALATALKQAGLNVKQLYYTGYDSTTLASTSAQQAYNGAYFETPIVFDRSIPAMATMLDNFSKYDPAYKAGSIPDLGLWGSYVAADLMIKGLQEAGKNPTRKSFITNLRTVTDYTAGGILPSPTTFANFGTPAMLPATYCSYFVQLVDGKFVTTNNGKALCSPLVTFKP